MHIEPGTVAFSFLSPGTVRHEFADSILSTLLAYPHGDCPIRAQVTLQSGPRVAAARCQIVEHFLRDTECEYLFMADTDMVWDGTDFVRLLNLAQKNKPCIAGGLCFIGRGDNEIKPTIYKMEEINGKLEMEYVMDYPRDEIIQVGATGAAFLMIHRQVLADMEDKFRVLPDGRHNPQPWFTESVLSGNSIGEDIAFCMRANAMGVPIYVDTSVKVGHVKHNQITEAKYDEQRAKRKAKKAKAKKALSLPEVS